MAYQYTVEEAFPEVAVEFTPVTNKILVQFRQPRQQTASGLYLPPQTLEGLQQSTVIAKLLAVGPYAFKGTGKGREWSEDINGKRPKPGDYIVINKWGGVQFMVEPIGFVPLPGDKSVHGGKVLLAIMNDVDVFGSDVVDPVNAQMHGVPTAM
jgi:co-chaperonin GroES (HSP10)